MTSEAVYGIPELHREEIRRARVIANPGYFSSAAILGLAPLLNHKLIEEDKIVIDGLSGTAGSGAETDRAIHHPEIGNNLVPYNVVDHRHTYEIEQERSRQHRQGRRACGRAEYEPDVWLRRNDRTQENRAASILKVRIVNII